MKDAPRTDHTCDQNSLTREVSLLTSKDTAELLKLHPATLDAYRVRGVGPRYFSPEGTRRVWYFEQDVLDWLASGERRSTSDGSGGSVK